MFKNLLLIVVIVVLGIVVGIFLNKSFPLNERNLVFPTPTPVSLNSEKLWGIIQKWRTSQNLTEYINSKALCKIAKDRVLNDPQLDNHKGLYKKYSDYPSVIQENLGVDVSEKEMLDGWLQSPAHAATLKKAYKYSCIFCDKGYCSQVFSNLENGTTNLLKN